VEETRRTLYEPLRGKLTLKRDGLGHILNELATDMVTAINNNIKTHHFKRQRKHLKLLHPDMKADQLKREQDEINQCMDEVPGFHPKLQKSIFYDLEAFPEKFLASLVHMNKLRETHELKLFSILPLRRGFVPKSIRLSSTALELLVKGDQTSRDYFTLRDLGESLKKDQKDGKRKQRDPEANKNELDILWNLYFNIAKVIHPRHKKYRFGHSITTDGISVSVLRELRVSTRKKRAKTKKKKSKDSSSPNECFSNIDPKKVVGVDPGKHSIIYMTTDDDKKTTDGRLQYTNVQRAFESGRKQFRRQQQQMKKDAPDIQKLEDQLSVHNTRTVSIPRFQEYLES
jgi:hypothetical protein